MHTARLTIRRVQPDDLGDLLEVNGDDTVTRFLPYPTWKSATDAQLWFERMAALQAAGATAQFVIEHRELARVIGSCLLFRHDPASGRAEIGYVLGRAHWGQGLMHEAMRGFIVHAFGTLGLRRLEADVNPLNQASVRLLERLGFRREGLLRQRWVTKGEVSDSLLFGLLRDEAQP
ncbi:GNAT family N-acetyltransferase [Piscinibacter aquaticus]|uniref:GNAT family N-acetyltransferase n=1 Tax=Piscinibacter aquaticus TaxID=392597 RepID=A0A5C6U0K1_9BURK|nr:GNAT family N-acetyltransferase [Piscinibacter aquaticus]